MIEQSQLNFLRYSQKAIRAECYQGLCAMPSQNVFLRHPIPFAQYVWFFVALCCIHAVNASTQCAHRLLTLHKLGIPTCGVLADKLFFPQPTSAVLGICSSYIRFSRLFAWGLG